MGQQTALQYLEKQLTLALSDELKCLRGLFVVAKEMEKKQIIDAYQSAWDISYAITGEEYYTETFNQQ